jgi:hypothetical protein
MASVESKRKRQAWAERFGRYRTSGLTVARFCAQERVSVNTFYYWARQSERRRFIVRDPVEAFAACSIAACQAAALSGCTRATDRVGLYAIPRRRGSLPV